MGSKKNQMLGISSKVMEIQRQEEKKRRQKRKGGEEKKKRIDITHLLNTYQEQRTVLRVLLELPPLILSTPLRGCDSKRSNNLI